MSSILPSRRPEGSGAPATPGKSWSGWHARLHRALLAQPSLLPRGVPLLLAVSGGQDSLCLLRLLVDLQRLHGWTLHVFHGDHRWHGTSAATAEAVRNLCTTWDLPCHLRVATTRAAGEAAARHWRYGVAAELCRELGCGHLVTGHTATDRAETLLFNLCRGSGSRGMASLRPCRPLSPGVALIRPLLIFTRQDTLACCEALKLPIQLDPSNADAALSRNRIRSQVLPVLEQVNPAAVRHLAACAAQLAAESDLLEQMAREALETMGGTAHTKLNGNQLAVLPRVLAQRCLAVWIAAHTSCHPSRRQVETALAHGLDQALFTRLHLQGGWVLMCRGGNLELRRSPCNGNTRSDQEQVGTLKPQSTPLSSNHGLPCFQHLPVVQPGQGTG